MDPMPALFSTVSRSSAEHCGRNNTASCPSNHHVIPAGEMHFDRDKPSVAGFNAVASDVEGLCRETAKTRLRPDHHRFLAAILILLERFSFQVPKTGKVRRHASPGD